jgi:hypothetical protein
MTIVGRRDLITGGATSVLIGVTRATNAAAAELNLANDYVKIRTRNDGKPVYWLSRGVKYLLADYRLTPLHGFNMVSSVVADKMADGGFTVRTLEAAVAVDLTGMKVTSSFFNPLTKTDENIPATAPMVVAYDFALDGIMTLPANDPRRAKSDFSGQIAVRTGMTDHITIEERFVIRPKDGGASALSEVITYTAEHATWQEASSAYTQARKSLAVLRNWNFGGGDTSAMLLSTYDGRKFMTLNELLAEIGAENIERAHPGFTQKLTGFN